MCQGVHGGKSLPPPNHIHTHTRCVLYQALWGSPSRRAHTPLVSRFQLIPFVIGGLAMCLTRGSGKRHRMRSLGNTQCLGSVCSSSAENKKKFVTYISDMKCNTNKHSSQEAQFSLVHIIHFRAVLFLLNLLTGV